MGCCIRVILLASCSGPEIPDAYGMIVNMVIIPRRLRAYTLLKIDIEEMVDEPARNHASGPAITAVASYPANSFEMIGGHYTAKSAAPRNFPVVSHAGPRECQGAERMVLGLTKSGVGRVGLFIMCQLFGRAIGNPSGFLWGMKCAIFRTRFVCHVLVYMGI